MEKKYLNKNARFQCGNGNAVWFSPQSGDSKVKIKGAEALLDDCCISLIGVPRPGQCNLVPDPSTGAPGSCTAVKIVGSWSNNVTLKVGGKGVLSSGCSISCPVGGLIKPFKPTIMALNVDDGAKAQTASIARKGGNDSENVNDEMQSANASASDVRNELTEKHEAENKPAEKNEAENKQENEEGKDIDQAVEYALCDYKNCSKANECEYLKTAHTPKETDERKNAAELANNMRKDSCDFYVGDFDAIVGLSYGSHPYSIAHHHIIPVNQCFKGVKEKEIAKRAKLVKLANYYNYDINKAENGIILPTMNEGYDRHSFEERKKVAFHAMKMLGRQWHKGPHGFTATITEEIDRVLSKSKSFKNYKTAVDELLNAFQDELEDDKKCRAGNYDQLAEDFTERMDEICKEVAEWLRKFENSPKESYPFFVSKFTFYYAYQKELSGYEEVLFGKDE